MVDLSSIYLILCFIPFTNTILDDDILYDIKWQPELTSVEKKRISIEEIFLRFSSSHLNWRIVMDLLPNVKRIIYAHYQLHKQRF